jgi:hypothetical protein
VVSHPGPMSVRGKTILYAVAALVVSGAIIAASIFSLGVQVPGVTTSSAAEGGQSAVLAIRLTDPPQVPPLTTALNLTYSSLSLLVGEPTGSGGQVTTKTATVTPSGGSATIDLLKLQNISQTIALASLPNDSILYSVTFDVTSIKIDVNNTLSSVALATGDSSFGVSIAQPSPCHTGDFALLQLNPVVVNTPSGFQLIPSAVGVMGHELTRGEDSLWSNHQISTGDDDHLNKAHGNVTSSLVALSVNGNVTTLTVLVNNSASFPMDLNALAIHGNFTVTGEICASPGWSEPGMGLGNSHSQEDHNEPSPRFCVVPIHMDEVVLVPVLSSTSTTTSTSSSQCSTGSLALVNGAADDDRGRMTLAAGQCAELTFVGELSFGNAPFVLVPSTAAGQNYILHVIASNGANQLVNCVLPLGPDSCKVLAPQPSFNDW